MSGPLLVLPLSRGQKGSAQVRRIDAERYVVTLGGDVGGSVQRSDDIECPADILRLLSEGRGFAMPGLAGNPTVGGGIELLYGAERRGKRNFVTGTIEPVDLAQLAAFLSGDNPSAVVLANRG
jgi:hypothetical protein